MFATHHILSPKATWWRPHINIGYAAVAEATTHEFTEGAGVERFFTETISSLPVGGSTQSGSPGRTSPSPKPTNRPANCLCCLTSKSQLYSSSFHAFHLLIALELITNRAYNRKCSLADAGHHMNRREKTSRGGRNVSSSNNQCLTKISFTGLAVASSIHVRAADAMIHQRGKKITAVSTLRVPMMDWSAPRFFMSFTAVALPR